MTLLWGTPVKFMADKTQYEGRVLSSFQTQEGTWMSAVQVAPNTIFMKATHCLTVVDKTDRPEKTLPPLAEGGKH